MTQALNEIFAALPDWASFSDGEHATVSCEIPDQEYAEWLGLNNGGTAFGGALRFFPARAQGWMSGVCEWNRSPWRETYGSLRPDIVIFAEDAFGLQFGFDREARVAIFWGETAEVEQLEVSLRDFIGLVTADPENTISYTLYQEAVAALGSPGLNEHLAFKVETALGGKLGVENLMIMPSLDHMRGLAKIALQIAG